MTTSQVLVLAVAAITWYGFGSRMRRSFRYADVWTPAKTLLVVSGWICTLGQLTALFWFPPAELVGMRVGHWRFTAGRIYYSGQHCGPTGRPNLLSFLPRQLPVPFAQQGHIVMYAIRCMRHIFLPG
jgi:hypothetical protein